MERENNYFAAFLGFIILGVMSLFISIKIEEIIIALWGLAFWIPGITCGIMYIKQKFKMQDNNEEKKNEQEI